MGLPVPSLRLLVIESNLSVVVKSPLHSSSNLTQPNTPWTIKQIVTDAEQQMKSLQRTLLEGSSLEELEDYASALREVKQALEQACEQGRLTQKEVDMVLSNWLIGP